MKLLLVLGILFSFTATAQTTEADRDYKRAIDFIDFAKTQSVIEQNDDLDRVGETFKRNISNNLFSCNYLKQATSLVNNL